MLYYWSMRRVFELIDRNFSLSKLSDILKKDKHLEKNLPLITISREKGAGGAHIAEKLVRKLGKSWKVYHKEILEEIAKRTRSEKEVVRQVDEKTLSIFDEMVGSILGKSYLNLGSYYKSLVKVLSKIGYGRGYAVILGRGANFLMPNALKIRIIATNEHRIKLLMQGDKLTEAQARKIVEESDQKRKEFNQTVFHHDPRKAIHYDLVVQISDKLDFDDAANIIYNAAKRRFKLR